MATYYRFYMFLKERDSKKLKYCGPYNAKGKIAPIYGFYESSAYGIFDEAWHIDEDSFEEYDLEKYFPKSNEDAFFTNQLKLLYIKDLRSIPDNMHVQCYVRRDIIRKLEFKPELKEDFDPLLYNYEHDYDDNDVPVISPSEYNNLTLENKQNYIFYPYTNYQCAARHKKAIFTIAYNWFNENIEYTEGFKNYEIDDLVFVADF